MRSTNPNLPAEASLVQRCRAGDPDAWDELMDLHYDAVARFIFQLGPTLSREDVEEVCQEVFVSAVRHLATFRGASAFQTWLFRIAVNKARDYRDRQTAAKRGGGAVPLSLNAENSQTGLLLDPPSSQPGPDELLMQTERMQSLRRALDQVGDPCREIIELRYFGDLSYEELSAALQLNPKTVSSRLSKCLDRLGQIVPRFLQAEEKRPFSV